MSGPLWNAARLTKCERMVSPPVLGLFVSYAHVSEELTVHMGTSEKCLTTTSNVAVQGQQFHLRKAMIHFNGQRN